MVWKAQQEAFIAQFQQEKKGLILAGDGRSDSPGHSAKYGSYSLIELTTGKIVDFQLVQVCSEFQLCMCMNMYLVSVTTHFS